MSQSMGFFHKLERRCSGPNPSLLCVGLDPDDKSIFSRSSNSSKNVEISEKPPIWMIRGGKDSQRCQAAYDVCRNILSSSQSYAACVKPNSGFFEALSLEGLSVLKKVCELVEPDIPILLDAKRGDIGSTAKAYAYSAYNNLCVDGLTVSPYLGLDSLEPYIEDRSKGIFVLSKTSNLGSNDFQTLQVMGGGVGGDNEEGCQLYVKIARACREFCSKDEMSSSLKKFGGGIGFVVGATDVEALKAVRTECPDMWILCPGLGAQGGDLTACLNSALRSDSSGVIFPISRGISLAEDPRVAVESWHSAIEEGRRAFRESKTSS